MIPCIVIPHESASAFRQAKENTARSGLSAIAMARQAALLLLYVHGYEMPNCPVPLEFYRQAFELTLRGKREYTAEILSAMGGINRKQFSRYKALLRLSDEAVELADRHDLEEGVLRHVINLPQEDHEEVIQHIVRFGLTVKQVKELCEPNDEDDTEDEKLPRHIQQLVKLMCNVRTTTPNELARALLAQESDTDIARARLHSMKRLLEEAEKYL